MINTLVSIAEAPEASTVPTHQLVAYPQQRPDTYVLDMDGTLYNNSAYHRHAQRVDRDIYAKFLEEQHHIPDEQVNAFIRDQRRELGATMGIENAGLSQTLYHLGMREQDWHERRGEGYQPQEYFRPDPALLRTLEAMMQDHRRVVVASNSPMLAVRKVLTALGVSRQMLEQRLKLFAVDGLGVCKPDPAFFGQIASELGADPRRMASIGNELDKDGDPAVEAGYGAAIISDPSQIGQVVAQLEQVSNYQPVDMRALALRHFVPGRNRVVGIVGRAGAGKTSVTQRLVQEMAALGTLNCQKYNAHRIGLDSFFRQSSPDRAKWLGEEGLSQEERLRREDQANWWDFEKAAAVLRALRSGQPVHLEGVYDQNQKGEMVGVLDVQPAPTAEGNVYYMEGVGVPELAAMGLLDELIYVNAHQSVRRGRVYDRDVLKRGPQEAARRWMMTQRYENRTYAHTSPLIAGLPVTVVDNSLGQKPEDMTLRQLPQAVPSR